MYSANTNNQISTIFLNSRNAKRTGSTGIYEFEMETAISCSLSQMILLSLSEFQTPNTLPVFTAINNEFNYSVNDPITNVPLMTRNITIPDSIMNPIDFSNYINFNYITNRPPEYSAYEFSVNFNRQTFILEFSSNTKFTIISTTAYEALGLPDKAYQYPLEASVNPAYSIKWLPVSFVATHNIFIKTQEFTLNNINSFGEITNTLARIPVNVNPGHTIFYRPVELNRFLIPAKTIKNLALSFQNDKNQLIEIINFQLSFKIEFVFPQEREESYDKGTIDYYFKNNIIPDEEEEQDEAFGV